MTGKTLMILGGSRYVVPLIDAAHELGCRVVTCDYLPDNPAHAESDEYRNVSITDREAVLAVARELAIDGIVSFAADPGVTTAAYVAEVLGLPFQADYECTRILQTKDLFRGFLAKHGFATPWFVRVGMGDELAEVARMARFPAIVKPTDSAGSKGVRKVTDEDELFDAIEFARSFSLSGDCIIEQFLDPAGPSSDADGFTVDGKLVSVSFTSQHFDAHSANPYVPSSYTLPAGMDSAAQAELRNELQRLADLLGLRSGVYNIETRVSAEGTPYIMEVAPRGGGNRLSEFLRYASGVDYVRGSVRAALGYAVEGIEMPNYDGVWFQEMLRTAVAGRFEEVWFDPIFRDAHVVEEQLWVEPGTEVQAFGSANFAFGSIIMRFESQQELDEYRTDTARYMQVRVTPVPSR